MILFVTGTGTGVGKTMVTRGLTRSLKAKRFHVLAVKPLETGCAPNALDAAALERACDHPGLSEMPAFYRVAPPLSPYAATLAGQAPPDFAAIVRSCEHLAREADPLIVEGAGGLMVPLDATRTMADLALALGSKLLLVAPDRLGVLSDLLAVLECAERRNLPVAAIVLNRGASESDPSRAHNERIIAERASAPVLTFGGCADDDEALQAEADRSGLTRALGLTG